jgi:hypothetical protein
MATKPEPKPKPKEENSKENLQMHSLMPLSPSASLYSYSISHMDVMKDKIPAKILLNSYDF